jgi:hypothetical protein
MVKTGHNDDEKEDENETSIYRFCTKSENESR